MAARAVSVKKDADLSKIRDTSDPEGITWQTGEVMLCEVLKLGPRLCLTPQLAVDQG